MNRSMSGLEWGLLLLLSLLWGGSFFFSKVALDELRPFTVVLVRVALAAAVLHLLILARGQRMPTSWAAWQPFLIMGLLNNFIPFSLIFWGQTQIASGLAAILNATTPVWTVLLAHRFTHDEKLTLNKSIGVILGLAGAILIIGPEALSGIGSNVWAQLAVVVAAISYAFAGLFGKRFTGTPPLITATGQLTSTAVLMLPVVLIIDRPWTLPAPSMSSWAAMLALAVLSTSIAYIIYFRLLATAGATNLLLVTFLVPVSALILGSTFLDERLMPIHFGGMGLIGLGLLAIDGRLLSRKP